MRPKQPTGETMDLGNLPQYWRAINEEFNAVDNLPSLSDSQMLTARAFDEAQPAGPRTYMEVDRYLTVARDNHEALLSLLEHRGATLWAPWSLLRPTFESSFLALWILDPEDGRTRRFRGLRCEVLDTYEQRKHRAAFKAIPEVSRLIQDNEEHVERTSIATYKKEALALGQPWDRTHQKVNVVQELKTLSVARDDPNVGAFLEATWRLLSGYEHGFGWAALSGSDQTIMAHVPGGADMHLVINDDQFINAAKSTYLLTITACRMLRRRHGEPSRNR